MTRRRKRFGLAPRCRLTLVSVIVGVVAPAALGACGSEPAAGVEVPPVVVDQEGLTALPEATTYAKLATAPIDPGSTPATAGRVLHPKKDLVVYQDRGGHPFAKLPTLQVGSPTWVPVITEQGPWVQVLLPSRPNGSTGWVYVNNNVESAQNPFTVIVRRDAFELEIRNGDRSAGTWKIGVGKAEYPTPTGRAFIVASIAETVNTYSPIVLPLSFHSDSHQTFGSGSGTVGIHTWPDNSFVGKADSDGCIRVTKEVLDKLAELPLGTIVTIL
jgi:lipoprotein-anchoring transpeptidase ErfK/SrfK